MATAVCLKSESADYYMFAMDSENLETISDFCMALKDQWYITEDSVYLEELYTDDFEYKEVQKAVSKMLDENTPSY